MMENTKDPTRSCNGCRFAEWVRTKTDRLSPSGDGQCRYEFPPVIMPWAHRRGQKILYPGAQYVSRFINHDPCQTWEKQQ
jgi:hypothetical protein